MRIATLGGVLDVRACRTRSVTRQAAPAGVGDRAGQDAVDNRPADVGGEYTLAAMERAGKRPDDLMFGVEPLDGNRRGGRYAGL